MCNHIKCIARAADPARYVARCEHGTIHLIWGNAAYYLNRDGLYELRQMLENAELIYDTRTRSSQGDDAALKFIELWFQDAGLRVHTADLQDLRALVAETIDYVETEPSPTLTSFLDDLHTTLDNSHPVTRAARWN